MNKQLETRMESLKDSLENGCQALADQARGASASTSRLIRREPCKAMAVAVLAGAALGILLARSR